jgi:hypothetical protein
MQEAGTWRPDRIEREEKERIRNWNLCDGRSNVFGGRWTTGSEGRKVWRPPQRTERAKLWQRALELKVATGK